MKRTALLIGTLCLMTVIVSAKEADPFTGKWETRTPMSEPLNLIASAEEGFVSLDIKVEPSGKVSGKVGLPGPSKPSKWTEGGLPFVLSINNLLWDKIEMGARIDNSLTLTTHTRLITMLGELSDATVETVWTAQLRDAKTLILRQEVRTIPAVAPATFTLKPKR